MVAGIGALGAVAAGFPIGLGFGAGYTFGSRYGFERLFPVFQQHGVQGVINLIRSEVSQVSSAVSQQAGILGIPGFGTTPPALGATPGGNNFNTDNAAIGSIQAGFGGQLPSVKPAPTPHDRLTPDQEISEQRRKANEAGAARIQSLGEHPEQARLNHMRLQIKQLQDAIKVVRQDEKNVYTANGSTIPKIRYHQFSVQVKTTIKGLTKQISNIKRDNPSLR